MAKGLVAVSEYAPGASGTSLDEGRRRWYAERLEEGHILLFEPAPFALPDAGERAALAGVRQASAAYHKNISYRPGEDRVKGIATSGADAETVRQVLRDYSRNAIRLLTDLFPFYAARWSLDFASFRPMEERGRQLSLRARNDLLHVDAFPTRPTNGSRILRVFTNVNPTVSRWWITTETFDILAPRLAMDAGLGGIAAGARSPWRHVVRGFATLARRLGVHREPRSPYDRFMLGFHNYLKANTAFQAQCPKHRWEFRAGSTWIVLTDMVPHAVESGQFALEQTVIVPREALVRPEVAPITVLEGLCHVPLTA
ncbi:MAG TPA: Kdo hydroxylase family protein [Candidatus Methylomirabilis sp.]|nr:Kdo hydroxylase family protein [Candidatus Methylomirabilis sp.]